MQNIKFTDGHDELRSYESRLDVVSMTPQSFMNTFQTYKNSDCVIIFATHFGAVVNIL